MDPALKTPELPEARTPIHTRTVTYQAWHRPDGLWDIEGRLTDTKPYDYSSPGLDHVPVGTPVHDMLICATVDDGLTIRHITATMFNRPFDRCMDAQAPMQRLVGATMGRGWRAVIETALGGVQGCTHLRELMFNMATAAMQAVPGYRRYLDLQAGREIPPPTEMPMHLGRCMSWDTDGPLVARVYPQFAGRAVGRPVK